MPAAQAVMLRALITSMFFLLAVFPLFAGGQGEERLEQVDRLIEDRAYNQAFKLLNEIMVDNPELWDRAQERMDELLSVVDRKNTLEREIFEAMREGDVDAAFVRLERLQELDPQPNRDAEELISEIMYTVGIIRNDNLLQDLMERARSALDAGDRERALDLYLSGFEIGRSIFEDTDYGETLVDVVASVNRSLAEIESRVNRFKERRPQFESVYDRAQELLDSYTTGTDLEPIRSNLQGLIDVVSDLAAGSAGIVAQNEEMQALRRSLRDNLERLEDVYYLSYIDTLVTGRADEGEEGILEALDIGLGESSDAIIARVEELLEGEYGKAEAAFVRGDFADAEPSFRSAEELAGLLRDASGLAAYRISPEAGLSLDAEETRIAERELRRIAGSRARADAADRFRGLMPFLAEADELTDPPEGLSLPGLSDRRRTVLEAITRTEEELAHTRAVAVPYVSGELSGYVAEDERALLDPAVEDLETQESRLRALDSRIVGRMIDTRVASVRGDFVPEQTERVERAESLIQGRDTGPGTGFTEEIETHRFPSAAKELLETTVSDLADLTARLNGIIASYEDEPSYVLESEPVESSLAAGTELLSEIGELGAVVTTDLEGAEELIARAARLKTETRASIAAGNELVEENNDLLEKEEYLFARDEVVPRTLNTAASALSVEWNEGFREEVSEWAFSYADRITQARSAFLQRIVERELADAELYLAANEADMQQDEFETALANLTPVQRALADSRSFLPAPQFEGRIAEAIASLETEIREARAEKLRRNTDEEIAEAESYLASVESDMQEEEYREALEYLEPIRADLEVAQNFAPDGVFASRVNGKIAELQNEMRQARAEELRRNTDEALAAAERYYQEVREGIRQDQYEEALSRLTPVERAFREAEQFLPNESFETRITEALSTLESDIEEARAVVLRNRTREELAQAESYYRSVADDMQQGDYEQALSLIDPVEDAFTVAQGFLPSEAFEAEIEGQVSDLEGRITTARAEELRRNTEEALTDARLYYESVDEDMEADEYNRAVSELEPVRAAFDRAESFASSEEFAERLTSRIEALREQIAAARADKLRRNTDEEISEAESYLASVESDMQEEEYREALEYLEPIRADLEVAQDFAPDEEFSSRVNGKIAELQNEMRQARAEELRRNTDEALAAAERYYQEVGEGIRQDQYEEALSRLTPAERAFREAEQFLPNESFETRITEALSTLESDINAARAKVLRDRTEQALADARTYYRSVEDDMDRQEYLSAVEQLEPVRSAFDIAEEFASDPQFNSRITDALAALESDITQAHARKLRSDTEQELAEAESFYESVVAGGMDEEEYENARRLLPPVENALQTAESFDSDPDFRGRIETRVADLRQSIIDARAETMRTIAVTRIAEAEQTFEGYRDEMTAERYDETLGKLPQAEQRVAEAQAFQADADFAETANERVAAVRNGAEQARAALLRGRTDERLATAEEYLDRHEDEMTREIYETREAYLDPVEDALSSAQDFLPSEEFRAGIRDRIETVTEGFDRAHLAYLQGQTDDRLAEARDYLDETRVNMSEDEYETALANLGPVEEALETSESFISDDEFRAEIEESIATLAANIRSARAEQLRGEALALLERAAESADAGVTAANENNVPTATDEFADAREYLQQVSSLTGTANEVVEDNGFTRTVDNRIGVLQQRIVDAEIAIVVREVRQLITQAQNAYANGEYELAYGYITEAETRWEDASTEPNTEVEYWFNIINNARQALSGREIDENDPRYNTVRAFLNAAQQDFREGRDLLEAGRTEAAQEKFDSARDGLLSVQVLFPLNREAGILNLRISRLTESRAAYRQRLDNLVTEARREFDVNTAQAYAYLTDIREIEPDYPGLDELILEAEYRLGIKERPLDPAVVARANNLVSEARSIYNTYRAGQYDPVVREAQFKRALELLDQALSLNPRLTEASALKDEISTNVGSDRKLALPSEAQSDFERARDLYVEENDVAAAFLITSRLVSNEENRGFQPLVDLHSRLQAEFGN